MPRCHWRYDSGAVKGIQNGPKHIIHTRHIVVKNKNKNKNKNKKEKDVILLTLYEIDDAMAFLLDEETGEIKDYDAYCQLQMDRDAKIENTICWVKDIDAENTALDNEIRNLQERKKKNTKLKENLKYYVSRALDGKPFKSARGTANFRKSTRLEVEDEPMLIEWAQVNDHDDLINYGEPEVSKRKVTDAIKSGVDIPFCHLEERQNVVIK